MIWKKDIELFLKVLQSKFTEQVYGAGLQSRFTEQVYGAGLRSRFTEQVYGAGLIIEVNGVQISCNYLVRFY